MTKRAFRILWVFCRYRLDRLLPESFSRPWWLTLLLAPLHLVPPPENSRAVSLRLGLEELGPIFVKFGQLLSTRRDLFDDEISGELAKLQDQVPAFSPTLARELIEHSLGQPVTEIFQRFDTEPMASASVAQVHGACLNSGDEVVVKVIRPGIEKTIEMDIRLLLVMASLIERYWQDGRRLHPIQIVQDYRTTIFKELDLRLEAANANQLRKNFAGSDDLHVPTVYWDYCRHNVMVMERVSGINVDDIATLKEHGINLQRLAHLGVEIFFTQVFEHNFFHADMHPGNVFVTYNHPDHPQYIALDCAIVGSLTEYDKDYLARNLLAFFNQDYHEVARLHIDSGWVPPGTDIQAFEGVIRSVCEPVFEKPISEISFGKVVLSLFQTARMFDMEVQPQLVLLQKTLLNIEGLGRQIYPELNLWDTAKPFLESWMKRQTGMSAILQEIASKSPRLLSQLPMLPDLAFDALTQVRKLGAYHRTQSRELEDLRLQLQKSTSSTSSTRWAVILLVSALVLASGSDSLVVEQIPTGSWILGSLGIIWLLAKG